MRVKKNDTVLVMTGKDAGKTGKVLSSMPKSGRITVEGVNMQKRHKKARSAQETSQIVTAEGFIDASNVEVICPACGKATRVEYKFVDGKKVRTCKKCGATLDVKAETTKKEKKVAKKANEEVSEEVKEVKKTTRKKAAKKADAKTENA